MPFPGVELGQTDNRQGQDVPLTLVLIHPRKGQAHVFSMLREEFSNMLSGDGACLQFVYICGGVRRPSRVKAIKCVCDMRFL